MTTEPLAAVLDALGDRPRAGPDQDQGEPVTGLATGFRDLDLATGGLRPGSLTVVGGRPGAGTSALLLNTAAYVTVRLQQPVVYVDLVSRATEVATRLIADLARVGTRKVEMGALDDEERRKVDEAVQQLSDAPLQLLVGPEVDPAAIESAVDAVDDPALLVVDPLGPLVDVAYGPEDEARWDAGARVVYRLKRLGQRVEVPVLVGAELTAAVESRTDRRPRLHDLAGTSTKEFVADLVLMIYRDEYYYPDSPDRGLAELLIRKNRFGMIGMVRLAFLKHLTKFANLARPDDGQD